jgi:transposase
MGLKRGKSDKADAWEIANYAWLRRDELVPSVPPAKNLLELQRMMSLREQLVKQQNRYIRLYTFARIVGI